MSVRTNLLHLVRLEDRVTPSLTPVGAEFQVNTLTQGNQWQPAVACDTEGNFVVAFSGFDTTAPAGWAIMARRYSADGTPQGPQFRVATVPSMYSSDVNVDMGPDGNFVIVWDSTAESPYPSAWNVFAQQFDSMGTPIGSAITVTDTMTEECLRPRVSISSSGNFAVSWTTPLGAHVYYRTYASTGIPTSLPIQVDDPLVPASDIDLAYTDQGCLAIVWQGYENSSYGLDVFLCIFETNNQPLTAATKVNSSVIGDQEDPDVTCDSLGTIIVGWWSSGSGLPNFVEGIDIRRFSNQGTPISTEIPMYSTSTFSRFPTVAAYGNGQVAMAWGFSSGNSANAPEVLARTIDTQSGTMEGIVQVNTFVTEVQTYPTVAADADGDTIIAWRSEGQDGSGSGIFAQRFAGSAPRPAPLVINNGETQRSKIKSAELDFHRKLTLPANPSAAFELTGPTGTIPMTVDTSASTPAGSKLKLTFPDLPDGRYTLRMLAAQVTDSAGQHLDGNGDGIPGDDFVTTFHKLTGDFNGDARVDGADFLMFRLNYNSNGPSIFDLDGDGVVNANDFLRFRLQFLTMV